MDYEIMMNGIVKIGQFAPEFEAISTNEKISLNDYKGKWIVLFSHPRRLITTYQKTNMKKMLVFLVV